MKKIKIAAEIVVFAVLFLFLFYVVDVTLSIKNSDGIAQMKDLYNYPKDSIDVIFLGSSHIGVNIDTEQLCNEYGIASYKLWGSTQPIWNSYYNLVEVLKRQRPKLVVLETLAMTHTIEYQSYAEVFNNVSGMRLSLNKLRNIWASTASENRNSVIIGFTTYHNRYTELNSGDFKNYYWNYSFNQKKNIKNWYAIRVMPEPSVSTAKRPFGEKQERYFKKFISLCQRENIPLLLISAPYSMPDEERERLNTLKEYAEENNIPYLDLQTNYKDIGIDFTSDYGDDGGHFNSYGIKKFTDAVGEYLRSHYDLPERYGDPYFAYSVPSDAEYAIYEPFVGDGEMEFIDTGISLFSDPESAWTVISRINTTVASNEKIYFSCFSESEPYRGLLVRRADGNEIDVVVGSNYYCKVELPQNRRFVALAITYNSGEYCIYLDGKKVHAYIKSPCDSYNGTLTIGSQWLANNQLGKFSAVTLDKFEIYDWRFSDAEISDWMAENTYIPSKDEMLENYIKEYTGNLNYTLEYPFSGNGSDYYLDTGVQLFADPQQNWELKCDIEISHSIDDGVYLSCFSEEVDAYRGLLIRVSNRELQILLANGQMLTQPISAGGDYDIDIKKDGNIYEVFVMGSSIGVIEGDCEPYYGPLLIDAELDENYRPFRYSSFTINSLEIIQK